MEEEERIVYLFRKLQAVGEHLFDDNCFFIELLEKEPDNQIWRRSFVRSVFAEIEGTLYGMKQLAYYASENAIFTSAEEMFLLEEDYELDKGKVKIRRAKITLTNNILFAFSAFARANKTTYELKVDGSEWSDFKKAIMVRDRLMHPQDEQDLTVTDQEYVIINNTLTWFRRNYEKVYKIVNEAMDKSIEVLKTNNEELKREAEELESKIEALRGKHVSGELKQPYE